MLCRWSVPRVVQGKVHHCCTNRRPGYWLLWRSRTWKWAVLQNEWFSRMMVTVSVWSNIKHQKLQNCFHFKHTLILKRVVGKVFKSMITGPDLTLWYSRCNTSIFINIYGSPWCQQQRSVRSQSINDDELEKFTWQQNVKVSLSSQSLNTGNIVNPQAELKLENL